MKLGLLYEMQRPYEGTNVDENRLYKEVVEQCVVAEEMGFDSFWLVEHHFLIGFSASPCPEVQKKASGCCYQRRRFPISWPLTCRPTAKISSRRSQWARL
jgi:alkanesulfonate monooxygenase SsuD/methylene tetrahydromethanopterin reductase-like flavin-dependent oxidoreductase (luciferase family)